MADRVVVGEGNTCDDRSGIHVRGLHHDYDGLISLKQFKSALVVFERSKAVLLLFKTV
jgi:hypothetical protein